MENIKRVFGKKAAALTKLAIAITLTSCSSGYMAPKTPPLTESLPISKNEVNIVIYSDGNGGYQKTGKLIPDILKEKDIEFDGKNKVKFKLKLIESSSGNLNPRDLKDFDILVNFINPPQAKPSPKCPNPSEWKDGPSKRPPLKVGNRYIELKKEKHKDKACYNYTIGIDTDKDGVSDIIIDPWLRIRY